MPRPPRARTVLAAAAAAAALLLAGCQARFERFAFTIPGRPPIGIRESRATRPDREGVLAPTRESRATPVYTLSRSLTADDPGLAFALSYSGSLAECTLTLYSGRKTVLREATLPTPPAQARFRYLVPLEIGEQVQAFQVSAGPSAAEPAGQEPSLQLLGAGIEPFFRGFEVRAGEVVLDASLTGISLGKSRVQASISRAARDAMSSSPWSISLVPGEAGGEAGGEASVALYSAAGAAARFRVDLDALAGPFSLRQGAVGFVPRDIRADSLSLQRLEISFPRDTGPIPADPGLLLSWDRSAWRQPGWELFSWERMPRVLIFDTADYRVQDRLFKRLAFFVEKAGHAGTIPGWESLEGLHGWNAHDYRAEDLARFFSAARARGVALLAEEAALEGILVAEGVIRETAAGIEPGTGAVLSLSRSSSALLRDLLLTHECFHGVYFALPAFRAASARAWEALSDVEKETWLRFLAGKSYNTTDPGLVVNEFQSYLFQQPRAGVPGFQALTLSRLRARSAGDAALVARLLAEHPDSMLRSFDGLEAGLRAAGGPPGGRAIAVKKLQ